MDTKVRKLKTNHRIHHPRADIECLNVQKVNSERAIIQQESIKKKHHHRTKIF